MCPLFRLDIACVASVSARVRREKLGREQKKGMTGEGEALALTSSNSFNSSNFRAISRLETLATQARLDKTSRHQGLEKPSPFIDSCLNLHLSATATATTAFLRIPNYQNNLSTTASFFQRMTKKSGMVTKFDPY